MSQRTRTLVFVSAATALSLLGDQVLYSVLPVYYAQLGLSAVQVGILLSANRWVRLVTNELAHRVDGGRGWFVAAFVLGSLTTAAYVFTHSFAVLLAARLLWGLAWSFIRHIGVAAIMFHTPVSASGRAMGTFNGISRLGSVAFARYVTSADFGAACGPMIGWLAIDGLGLPSTGMAIGAVLYGICALLLALAP